MPRNEPRPLTREEQDRRDSAHPALVAAQVRETPVTVHYFKNDGTKGAATGPVGFFNGRLSTESVTIDTSASKGRPTTVNLRNVVRVLS